MSPGRRPAILGRLGGDLAGTIGATLAVQLALLVNGVATARMLGPLDRGHWALLLLLATVIPLVVTMGLPLAITYWIARDPSIARPLLRRLRWVLAGQMAVLAILEGVGLYVLFRGETANVQHAAALSLPCSLALISWFFALAILQGGQRFKALNLLRVAGPVANAGVMVAFLAAGVHSLVVVTMTAVVIFTISAAWTALIALRGLPAAPPHQDASLLPTLAEMMKFGLKSLLGSVTPSENFQIDQALVGITLSRASLGVYAVAVAFTNLPRFVAQGIGLVAYPQIAADPDGRGQRRKILRFSAMTLLLCGAVVVATILAVPFLTPLLFGDAFSGAVGVAQILVVSALLVGLRRVLAECARGAGRPGLGSIAELVALACLLISFPLFPPSGLEGVATLLVLSGAVGLLCMVVGLLVWRPRPERPAIAPARGAVPEPLPASTEL